MTASVPGRYASALFELAREQGKTTEVEGELTSFQEKLDASPDLTRLVRSPVFSAEEQGKALAAVLARGGMTGLSASFLKLLAKNRRLFAASEMIKAYRGIAARARGEVVAEVASAHALNDAQMNELKATLRAYVARQALGKDVTIQTRVDPNLLGGLVVKIGSRMIDNSLRTKLNSLKVAMKGTG